MPLSPLSHTIRDVGIQVRALGLTCSYSHNYREFRIDYPRNDSRWNEDSAYFTTYRDDAVATAKIMASAPRIN